MALFLWLRHDRAERSATEQEQNPDRHVGHAGLTFSLGFDHSGR
jgi:hypothetical protein